MGLNEIQLELWPGWVCWAPGNIDWRGFGEPSGYKGTWYKQYVYALAEPMSGTVFYVGISKNPITRYYGHLSGCRRFDCVNKQLCAWIRALLAEHHCPQMMILDISNYRDRHDKEMTWIEQLIGMGEPLTNIVGA